MSYERRYKAIGAKTVFDDLATPLADRIAFIDEDETIGGNWTFNGVVRIAYDTDASLSSTDHPLQIGEDTSHNLIFDNNEIIARLNGEASTLFLQADGGQVHIGTGTPLEALQVDADLSQFNSTTDGLIADFGSESDNTDEFKIVRIKSNGFARLLVNGDFSNTSGEPGGAALEVNVDGSNGVVGGFISVVNSADTDGRGNSHTGAVANSVLISGVGGASRRIQFSANEGGPVDIFFSSSGPAIYIGERASAGGDVSGFGQLWVRSSDGALMFTDSSGNTTAIT